MYPGTLLLFILFKYIIFYLPLHIPHPFNNNNNNHNNNNNNKKDKYKSQYIRNNLSTKLIKNQI